MQVRAQSGQARSAPRGAVVHAASSPSPSRFSSWRVVRAAALAALTALASLGGLGCDGSTGAEDAAPREDTGPGVDGASGLDGGSRDATAGEGSVRADATAQDALGDGPPTLADGALDPFVSDFLLQDVNPNSATRGMQLSPQRFRGDVSAWYFATASCDYCATQFAYLGMLQRALDATTTRRRVHIAGVADPISEGLTNTIVRAETLPMLQDTRAMNVAGAWSTRLRDVVILDEVAHRVAVFNLTEHSLESRENFERLRALLVELANR